MHAYALLVCNPKAVPKHFLYPAIAADCPNKALSILHVKVTSTSYSTRLYRRLSVLPQEYYLLALAQPRRDSKTLGEDSVRSNPARSFSSAFKPSFLKTGASITKSASEAAQMGPGNVSGPRRSSLHLSADSSAIQSNSAHNPASDSMAIINVDLGAAAGLPQGAVVQAEGVSGDPKQEAQTLPVGDHEHHDEQVHLLFLCYVSPLPHCDWHWHGPVIGMNTPCNPIMFASVEYVCSTSQHISLLYIYDISVFKSCVCMYLEVGWFQSTTPD